jgi:hypothetical protein
MVSVNALNPERVGRPKTVVDPKLVKAAADARNQYEQADEALTAARKYRRHVIADFRQAGYGYDIIAEQLGMTKGRVQQEVKEMGL